MLLWVGNSPSPASADSSTRAIAALVEQRVIGDPQADAVVARVNGYEIKKRTVALTVLFAQLPGATGFASPTEALAHEIDQALLRQAAAKANVVVTEQEADAQVAGALQPYRDGLRSADEVAFFDAFLRAQGTNLADAGTNAAYRDALRGNLAIGRFLNSQGRSREEILQGLRAAATIETFPELLPSARAE